jgi:hypothetical protein
MAHNDTPEEKFCGTFLVSLFQEWAPVNVFEINQDGKIVSWDLPWKSWCGFYPSDTPRRVKRTESSYRAILRFKIFVKENSTEQWGGNRVVPKMVDMI